MVRAHLELTSRWVYRVTIKAGDLEPWLHNTVYYYATSAVDFAMAELGLDNKTATEISALMRGEEVVYENRDKQASIRRMWLEIDRKNDNDADAATR